MKRTFLVIGAAIVLSAGSCDNECIGPECVDAPPPEAGPVDTETDWCDVRDDVLPSCTGSGCHGANGLDPILSGDDDTVYAALLQNGSSGSPYVVPGSPEMSYLWRKVEGTHLDPEVGGSGSQMPIGGFEGVFDADEELALRVKLRDWIANGAGTTCSGGSDAGVVRDAGSAPDAGESDAGSPVDTGPASICGDGEVTGDEACDDGNDEDGDGCESDCTLTPSPYCAIVGRLAACANCHGNSGGFTLGNNIQAWSDNTVNQASSNNRGNGMSYITPGSKEQSFLWLKVSGRQGEAGGQSPGGAMPPGGGSWPPAAVVLLGDWIDANLPTPENCP